MAVPSTVRPREGTAPMRDFASGCHGVVRGGGGL
ncbi:hypothetical protein FB470_001072 [Amycolatopsis thermophila]|uniref:Uncharacterized protein n=1 Tax=Amycolatopsis thermophila TaxID=206084 RepID=A0ABU0EPV2_9PSEU|nr:hypothetical protein [Amycolatopsis thermophila]